MDETIKLGFFLVVTIALIMSALSTSNYSINLGNEKNIGGLAVESFEDSDSYASPHDPFNSDVQLVRIETFENDADSFHATTTVTQDGGFIYHTAYYLNKGAWVPFELFDNGKDWESHTASASFDANYKDYLFESGDELFVATYSCKKYDGDWKCGCKNVDDCGYWMIQSADVVSVTPYQYLEIGSQSNEVYDEDLFSVDVLIRNHEGHNEDSVAGFDVDVEFDDKIEFVSLDYGDFLGSPDEVTCDDYSKVANGLSGVACYRNDRQVRDGVFGDGLLFTLNFRAKQNGYSLINLENNILVNHLKDLNLKTWENFNSEVIITSKPLNLLPPTNTGGVFNSAR